MRWTTRTVLAATAGVALVGGGALTAANAASGTPAPATTTAVTAGPQDDPQAAALATEAHNLQTQVAGLEDAVARLSAPVPTPTVTQPATPSDVTAVPVPSPHETPDVTAPTLHESSEYGEHESSDHGEHESQAYGDSGSDD